MNIYTKNNFETLPNVSRETLSDFIEYQNQIIKWQKAVNLISPKTIEEIWHRHFADSVGLYNHIPSNTNRIVDVGSGGGLPAIVCGIMAKHHRPDLHITMIESDMKKSMFLKEMVRILKLNAVVINNRIEKALETNPELCKFDLMTARALADLPTLLNFAKTLNLSHALLLKGERWQEEVNKANDIYSMEYLDYQSITNVNAKILHIKNFTKKI